MEFKTLKNITTKEILNVFNKSFADYFVPFCLTQEQLESKMLADKVNLDVSVGVFDQGALVAFILHGQDVIRRVITLYNGGTGVIPQKRGLGLTTQMHQFILPKLKERGIQALQLEVITENIQAFKSYKKSGYKIERKLWCYSGEITVLNTNNNLIIKSLQDYDWGIMEPFWDCSPTWQNSKNVIAELINTNVSLGAYIKKQLVGYVVYNPKNNRVQQIAVNKDFRRNKIASTLMGKLREDYGSRCSIINVDSSCKVVHAFFNSIGFKKTLEQLEMRLQLD